MARPKTNENCNQPGCTDKGYARQLCNRHYRQFRQGKELEYTDTSQETYNNKLWDYIKERLEIMDYYDFSDTLAKVDWAAPNIPAAIIAAKALYKPSGTFAVITAQQDNPAIHKAVMTWLNTHYGDKVAKVYFVSGGEANIIKAKARILMEQRANSFTDNNENILKGIRQELPNLTLYKATNGERRAWR